MQRITFEGCTCIVAAPEDIEQLERELTAAKEELRMAVEVIDERAKERESLQSELALLRKRVEAADGLAEAAGCVVNRDAEYDRDKWVKDGAGWDSDMIELKHADAAYRATEGKKWVRKTTLRSRRNLSCTARR